MYMNDGNKTKINLRNKSVFITGVAGFIGSNLAKRLLSTVEGVKVVGLDNMNHYYDVRLKEARLNELEQFDNFSFVKGNLADKAVIESIFEQYKPEIVVNLGAQAGVRYSITNPDAYVEANLMASITFWKPAAILTMKGILRWNIWFMRRVLPYTAAIKKCRTVRMTRWITRYRCMQRPRSPTN